MQIAVWRCGTCFGGFIKAPSGKTLVAKSDVIPREEWDPQICCPEDGTETSLVEIAGMAIDVCPKCNGVWLDDDELGKLNSLGLSDAPIPSDPATHSMATDVATDVAVSIVAATVFEALFGD